MSLLLDALKRAEKAKQEKATQEGRQGADVLSFGPPREDRGPAPATELRLEPRLEQSGSPVWAAPLTVKGPVGQADPQGEPLPGDQSRRPGASRLTSGAGGREPTPKAGSRAASLSAYPAGSRVPQASGTGLRPVVGSGRYRRPRRLAALLVASLFLFAMLAGYYGWAFYTTVHRSMTAGPGVFHGSSPPLAFVSDGATAPPGQSMPVAEASRMPRSGRDTPPPAGKSREVASPATRGASGPSTENVKAVAQATVSSPAETRPQVPSVAKHPTQPSRSAGEAPSPPVRPVGPPKRAGASARQRETGVTISRRRATDQTYTELRAGYEAYQAGELANAERHYREVAAREPQNRDALLGLAAVAMARGHPEEAYRLYGALLRRNPADRVALAALLLAQGREEPAQAESRLKLMLEQEPGAPHLAFALGSLYAGQARWSDAERAFFEAYRGDGSNGDYAYNLAVSLDHLGKGDAALGYYRLALDLAARRPVAFDRESTLRRIRLLEAHLTTHGSP
jgi:Flp pilus assembly protein TadD